MASLRKRRQRRDAIRARRATDKSKPVSTLLRPKVAELPSLVRRSIKKIDAKQFPKVQDWGVSNSFPVIDLPRKAVTGNLTSQVRAKPRASSSPIGSLSKTTERLPRKAASLLKSALPPKSSAIGKLLSRIALPSPKLPRPPKVGASSLSSLTSRRSSPLPTAATPALNSPVRSLLSPSHVPSPSPRRSDPPRDAPPTCKPRPSSSSPSPGSGSRGFVPWCR